jgi:protein translocase SEC61 complex gamma subunit
MLRESIWSLSGPRPLPLCTYSSLELSSLILPDRRLVKRCQKPDKKEFLKVARLTAVGFLAVGFLGFFVKLIFIPINQVRHDLSIYPEN